MHRRTFFMIAVAYEYHGLKLETYEEFADRLIDGFELNDEYELETHLIKIFGRDAILMPAWYDESLEEEAIKRLYLAVKNLEIV